MTIYEIKDEDSIEAAVTAFDRADREEFRRKGQAWEKKAIKDMDDRIFYPIIRGNGTFDRAG